MAKRDNGKKFWNFVGNLQGDKVVWMIVLLLILLSIVAIFSSTPLLAIQQHTTRTAIMKEQLLISLAGLFFIILCYNIRSQRFFRAVSKLGWGFSMLLLIFLVAHGNLGVIKALYINDAWRSISVFGFQVHVFEVVKVAMVMYLAWAVDAFQKKEYRIANLLSKLPHFHWLGKPGWQKIIYIYAPMFFVMGCVALGSGSSAAFIGFIMFVTILVGGLSMKELIAPAFALVAIIAGILLINKVTDGKMLEGTRIETWVSRLQGSGDALEDLHAAKPKSAEYYAALDKIRQPYSAKIAIKQGGLLGKGAGQSTQRYVVPVMYEDYMFSFIVANSVFHINKRT